LVWDLHNLFRRHAREIARSLRQRGVSPEDAADLTQDAFLRVLATPPREAGSNHNPRAYLHRVSHNLATNQLRRNRLVPMVELSEEIVAQVADPFPDPETVVYSRQCLALTAAALATLPDRTRKAFELHRLSGRTIAQVAEELGLSTTRTWALIRDAYRHLLNHVGDI